MEQGDHRPRDTTGAWAGEIGMVQMLPRDILARASMAMATADPPEDLGRPTRSCRRAQNAAGPGWQPNEPWLQEVTLPDSFDWSLTGLDKTLTRRQTGPSWARPRSRAQLADGSLRASILLPQGRKGPAFLAYPNFRVLFEWNKSFVYVTTAAYFATRLEGAPTLCGRRPGPGA